MTPTSTVADLQSVLSALADPVRLEMVRRLGAAAEPTACTDLYETITKGTASHHFKILREAGIVERIPEGQCARYGLRSAALEAAYPGLLPSVLAAANARPA